VAQAFNRQPVGRRMAIAAAGPAFNLLFTLAAFWLMFLIGKPDYQPVVGHVEHAAATAGFARGDRITRIDGQPVATWSDASQQLLQGAMERRDLAVVVEDAGGSERRRTLALSKLPADLADQDLYREVGISPRQFAAEPLIGSVSADSGAARAGLQAGDRIVSIDGTPIADWRDVPVAIARHAAEGKALQVGIERNGERQVLAATPSRNNAAAAGEPAWLLGIGAKAIDPQYDAMLRYGPLAAIPRAFSETWQRTRETLVMLGRMVTGEASLKNLSGVITIAQVANSSAQLGPAWFLNFLAIISLSLAILNLLPIPILDGGHLLYYLIELVKGSPVSENSQIVGQYVGLTLLMALMGLALYNDILRIAS
jgi:regulator of sigma E protease